MFEYEEPFDVTLPLDGVWNAIGHTEQFEGWWAWLRRLRRLRIDGGGLVSGAHLHGMVMPPFPSRIEVDFKLDKGLQEAPHALEISEIKPDDCRG